MVTSVLRPIGLWYTHPDLAPNFVSYIILLIIRSCYIFTLFQNAEVSNDFLDEDGDIMPERSRDNHGTSCAGIIAMAKNNGVCGVGVAYESQIAGKQMIAYMY